MAERHVRAAGGILFRRREDGTVEVAVIHRPRYDDWTLPKGKLEKRETIEDAAVREVEEETGLKVRRGPAAIQTEYRDRYGRRKTVDYFYMTPDGGSFAPNDEVDELRWLPVEEAARRLSHQRDAEIVRAVMRNPPPL